ncbi:MAG: transposase [Salinivenus sp.]
MRLLVDTLELTGNRRLLVGALAYRRRGLPIWWHVDRKPGVTGGEKQEAFLEELTDLVPSTTEAVLIGDGNFHSVDLFRAARQNGRAYCVRLHADTHLRDRKTDSQEAVSEEAVSEEASPEEMGIRSWRECRRLDPEEGGRRSLRGVSITKDHDFGPVNVLYRWDEGEDEPWRLVTNLPPGFRVVWFYQRRMWIEELFRDWQEGAFHLHQTRLYNPEKLSRLVLGLSLVYVWLVAVASYVAKRGWRPLIDRTDRRDDPRN